MHMTQAPPNATTLEREHYLHLINEGFTPDEIAELEMYGVRSVSSSEATGKLKIKKWSKSQGRWVSDGGLYFPFHEEYGQIRFNTAILVDGKKFKYLGPQKPSKVWMPKPKVAAFTEGFKDAAKPTLLGIPTGAIVGVDNIIYSVPQDCQVPTIFDSDGWRKPKVIRALVKGAIWTNGKINLFPPMPQYPDGGACEFFKCGNTISDYQRLIDEAMKPHEFIEAWVEHWDDFDSGLRAECATVATETIHLLQDTSAYIRELEQKVEAKEQDWITRG